MKFRLLAVILALLLVTAMGCIQPPAGPVGPAGLQGIEGPAGPQGPPGPAGQNADPAAFNQLTLLVLAQGKAIQNLQDDVQYLTDQVQWATRLWQQSQSTTTTTPPVHHHGGSDNTTQ